VIEENEGWGIGREPRFILGRGAGQLASARAPAHCSLVERRVRNRSARIDNILVLDDDVLIRMPIL
jgi:hypothetical protein